MSASEHLRIFGPPDLSGEAGRSRRCRSCGGWHRLDRPWPHNCREPAPPRARHLATPQVAPGFEPFTTGRLEGAAVIGDPRARREFMARHDLVDYDAGVTKPDEHWTRVREREREVVSDLKRFRETDPLALPPDLKAIERVGEGDTGGAGDIDANVEVIR